MWSASYFSHKTWRSLPQSQLWCSVHATWEREWFVKYKIPCSQYNIKWKLFEQLAWMWMSHVVDVSLDITYHFKSVNCTQGSGFYSTYACSTIYLANYLRLFEMKISERASWLGVQQSPSWNLLSQSMKRNMFFMHYIFHSCKIGRDFR